VLSSIVNNFKLSCCQLIGEKQLVIADLTYESQIDGTGQ